MKTQPWNVQRPNRQPFTYNGAVRAIREDRVFYTADMDAEAVKRSLVEHDGYPADIIVTRAFLHRPPSREPVGAKE